ncbi:MAG: glycine cleavage system protein GcvH [Firmicutes bacterium]|jgi:glycine cleavage system H protein|nr:glycine cleavage system protein GcvH [Bacillota bacterium]
MHPADRRYTKTHEWLKVEGAEGRVGITHHAQDHLGDVVFVELPAVGKQVKQGEQLCVVESVKAVADCYSPASGKVVKVNKRLADSPELLNKDPHGEAWIAVIELGDPGEVSSLLDSASYDKFCEEESGH